MLHILLCTGNHTRASMKAVITGWGLPTLARTAALLAQNPSCSPDYRSHNPDNCMSCVTTCMHGNEWSSSLDLLFS